MPKVMKVLGSVRNPAAQGENFSSSSNTFSFSFSSERVGGMSERNRHVEMEKNESERYIVGESVFIFI